jgi:hypothetical protein
MPLLGSRFRFHSDSTPQPEPARHLPSETGARGPTHTRVRRLCHVLRRGTYPSARYVDDVRTPRCPGRSSGPGTGTRRLIFVTRDDRTAGRYALWAQSGLLANARIGSAAEAEKR